MRFGRALKGETGRGKMAEFCGSTPDRARPPLALGAYIHRIAALSAPPAGKPG